MELLNLFTHHIYWVTRTLRFLLYFVQASRIADTVFYHFSIDAPIKWNKYMSLVLARSQKELVIKTLIFKSDLTEFKNVSLQNF